MSLGLDEGTVELEFEPSGLSEREVRSEAENTVKDAIRQLAETWRETIDAAWEDKMEKFGDDAEEAMMFFGKDHGFIWDKINPTEESNKGLKGAPGFAMTYNVVAELVQIFGPFIYHKNPYRKVEPTKPLVFPREAIVDPLLEYEIQALSENLNNEIMKIAGPIVEQAMAAGVDANAAQQGALQQVSGLPQFAEPQQKLNEMQAEWASQVQDFNRLNATQSKSLAKKSAKALIMHRLLNYTPNELGLREHSRRVVDETIIKGMGVWWTELKEFDDDERVLVGSFYDSIDNFLVSKCADFEHATWVGRRFCMPRWQAEERWPNAKFKSASRSKHKARTRRLEEDGAWGLPYEDSALEEDDLVVGWEIWTKMGIGARLPAMPEDVADKIDMFGDFCYLCISDCCDYPLNLTPDALFDESEGARDALLMSVTWPIPFHKDNEWPCTPNVYHWFPNSPYGMSHIKPAMGELKFLDYAMSFLARKIKNAATDIIGVLDAAGDEIEEALKDDGMADDNGYKIVRIQSHYGKSVADLFSIMQKPTFNSSIWDVIAAVAQRLDRRLGLSDRAFGAVSTRSRSAADANNEQAAFSIRPEDMANITEENSTKLCRKEAMAIAWFMTPEDVAPIIGEEAAFLYDKLIYNQENPIDVVREFDYRIEANSIRRPSVETDQENMMTLTQYTMPAIQTYCQSANNYQPLEEYFHQLGKAFPSMDVTGFKFPAATPPPPPQPTDAELKAMELQRMIAEANLNAQVQQAKNIESSMRLEELKLFTKADLASVTVSEKTQLAQIEIEKQVALMEQKIADAVLQRRIDQESHEQEMEQDARAFNVTATGVEEGKKMMPFYRRAERGFQ